MTVPIDPGFAIRLEAVDTVHHLVGLAVRSERLGAVAVLVGDGGTGRDVVVVVAAMAVATERIALLPLSTASSPAAVRRAGPALASLDELSGGRVVGCFPAAALRAGARTGGLPDVPLAAIERGRRRAGDPGTAGAIEGLVGVVAEGDRPRAAATGWSIWSPDPPRPGPPGGPGPPAAPDGRDGREPIDGREPVDGPAPDVVAHRLASNDVEELVAVAARATAAGQSPAIRTAWISPSGIMPSAPLA